MKKNYNVLCDCRGMFEDEVMETVLHNRGIEDIEHFLNPTEKDLLPLDSMKNIDKAFEIVNTSIEDNKTISVLFDTDTDGITSGTIITRYLSNFVGKKIKTFIDEGKKHGLIEQDLNQFNGIDLLIIVDSLDNSIEQYKELKERGIDIVVLDHHAIEPSIPYDNYVTLVSSQRNYENKQLSGAGVVWKFCKYIDEQYLTDYADELVDLAACGIVADMSNMTVMENRYIVSKGLEKIYNPAIKKIIGGFTFNSTAISFSIAPLINASNRMNKNEVAVNTFLSDDKKEVSAYVKELKKCKEEQNEEVQIMLPAIFSKCEEQIQNNILVAFIDTEHGISGLMGNKLLEKYQRPIFVLKDYGDEYRGSMRAIGVDDFRKICNDSKLGKADGHELASGITIKKENFDKFIDYVKENTPKLKTDMDIDVDIQLDLSDITRKMVDDIKKIDRISGEGFKPVKVFVEGIEEYTIGNMSNYKHLVIKPNSYLQIIKWNFDGSFEDMEDHSMMNDELKIVCNLDSGFFGRNFVLKAICDDIEEASCG